MCFARHPPTRTPLTHSRRPLRYSFIPQRRIIAPATTPGCNPLATPDEDFSIPKWPLPRIDPGSTHPAPRAPNPAPALPAQTMLLADRGYDSDWIREFARQREAWANVPQKRNRKGPICFSPYFYRARNLIERLFNKIKQCRRVAIRYDKLAANYPTIWPSSSSHQSELGCALMSPRPEIFCRTTASHPITAKAPRKKWSGTVLRASLLATLALVSLSRVFSQLGEFLAVHLGAPAARYLRGGPCPEE
jgi:transposase